MPVDMDESTIDLKDLLWQVVKGWKTLLVCMLVGGLVMNFVGVYQAHHPDEEENTEETVEEAPAEEKVEPAVLSAAEYGLLLTQQEASVVEETFSVYCAYRTQYQDYLSYYEGSGYMQIDPQNVACGRLEYYIDDHYSVEYPMMEEREMRDTIIQQYAQWLSGSETNAKVAKILGAEENARDLGYYVDAENSGNGVLTVTVVAADVNTRNRLLQAVEARIDEAKESFQDAFGAFDIQQVQQNLYVGFDWDVQDIQNSIRSELIAARDRMSGLNGGFSEQQNNYYNALIRELDASKGK